MTRSNDESSELRQQISTLASYVFVVGMGAYIGYIVAGPLGAVGGAVLAIPVALIAGIVMVVSVAWLLMPHSEDEHGA